MTKRGASRILARGRADGACKYAASLLMKKVSSRLPDCTHHSPTLQCSTRFIQLSSPSSPAHATERYGALHLRGDCYLQSSTFIKRTLQAVLQLLVLVWSPVKDISS